MEPLNEENTKLRYITPALQNAGWNLDHISCEDFFFTDGKIMINKGTGSRVNKGMKTDYQLCWPDTNQPLAVVEAKDNQKPVGFGLQQAIEYAAIRLAIGRSGGRILHAARRYRFHGEPPKPKTGRCCGRFRLRHWRLFNFRAKNLSRTG